MLELLDGTNRAWPLWLLFFVTTSGFAQEISASLVSKSSQLTVLPFSYLQDKTGALDWKAVQESGVVFSQAKKGITDFGFTTSVFWIRLDFTSVTAETKYLLELAYPLMDEV